MWKFMVAILVLGFATFSGVYAGNVGEEARARAVAQYIMAVSYELNDRPVEAVSAYEKSAVLNPGETMPHLRLAGYYARAGMQEMALKKLKTVLELDPQNTHAHYLLALVYSAQKKYDQAAQEYEIILKTASKDNPENLEIYIYLAQLYYSQGQYPQAIAQFNRILEIQPENVSANYLLATALLDTNHRDRARELFKKTLSIEPAHDGALNSLAYMYAEDGVNLDDALKMARNAVAIDPGNGAYYDTLGWTLHKKGMNAEALMALQKAEAYVQDAIIYNHMGDVYFDIKEFTLARKFWRKSLDIDADQPDVKAKLGQLEKTQALKE